MLSRLRRSSAAALLALLAWTSSVHAAGTIRLTEVMSNALTLGSMDWWEMTNYGDTAVDITGWKMDDNSFSFANSVSLVPYASGTDPAWSLVNPGESVVFMETATPATQIASYQSLWNLGSGTGTVRNPKLGSYSGSGIGLSSAGDAVCLFDSTGTEVTRVAFGAATTGSLVLLVVRLRGHPGLGPGRDRQHRAAEQRLHQCRVPARPTPARPESRSSWPRWSRCTGRRAARLSAAAARGTRLQTAGRLPTPTFREAPGWTDGRPTSAARRAR